MGTSPGDSTRPTTAPHEHLHALFDTHAARLYRLARRLVRNADDACDLVQETFLKVATSPSPVPSGQAEEACLVRVPVNIRRDQWRAEAVRRRAAPRLRAGPATSPESLYVLQVSVWEALHALAPRRRAVLVMHELEGLPVPAIASLLGISAITVRWHLSRARRELSRHIRPESGVADDHTQTAVAAGRPPASRSASKP